MSDPTDDYIERVGDALTELAESVSSKGTEHDSVTKLRICLSSVRYAPRLPFRLYGFALQPLDDRGQPTDPFRHDDELKCVLVMNQPLELQRESALSFLFDLVLRQVPVRSVAQGDGSIDELPQLTAGAENAAAEASGDLLRFGWARTADALRARSEEAGFALEVRYQRDPFPSRGEVARRTPALRRLYNTNPSVREAVDRTVSRVGGSEPTLRGGATEELRRVVQQNTMLAGVRQFISQAYRDADVCGNGYWVTTNIASIPRIACLQPDQVEILGPDAYQLHRPNGVADVSSPVMHLRGLEQFSSPYGISPWEPLLFALTQDDVVRSTRAMVAHWGSRPGLSEARRKDLERFKRVVDVIERQIEERVALLTRFPRERLPRAARNLYFRGQEQYPDDPLCQRPARRSPSRNQ